MSTASPGKGPSHSYRLILIGVLIVAAIGLSVYRTWFVSAEVAVTPEQDVLAHLHRHLSLIPLPAHVEQVTDVDFLRRVNPKLSAFIQNGDWMITYSDMVIFYRLSTDAVIQTIPR